MTLIDARVDAIIPSFVTAILFGLYFASFIHSVRWLLCEDEGWRMQKRVNRTLVTATLLVFFLSTISFSMTAIEVSPRTVSPVPPYVTMLETMFGSDAVYLFILIIADGVLIYRCWIIFSKNWFVIWFPLVLWCSCLICAIFSFYCEMTFELRLLYRLDGTLASLYRSSIRMCRVGQYLGEPEPELLAFYVCNIVVNTYTTSALVYKLWRVAKNNGGTTRLQKTSQILAESGILYTLSSAFFLAYWIDLYIINSPWATEDEYSLLYLLGHVAKPIGIFMPGIAFNLITIRIGEQRARGQDTWVDSIDDASNAQILSEMLDHPDTLTQQEVESTDVGKERYERTARAMEINGTEFGEMMEVDRREQSPEQE